MLHLIKLGMLRREVLGRVSWFWETVILTELVLRRVALIEVAWLVRILLMAVKVVLWHRRVELPLTNHAVLKHTHLRRSMDLRILRKILRC